MQKKEFNLIYAVLLISFSFVSSNIKCKENEIINRKKAKMAGFTVEINLKKSIYYCNEQCKIDVKLTNIQKKIVELPKSFFGIPVYFKLKSTLPEGPTYEFSQQKFDLVLNPNVQIPGPVATAQVGSSESVTYEEELSLIATEYILPGKYLLSAIVLHDNDTLVSSEKEIDFQVPPIMALSVFDSKSDNSIHWVYVVKQTDNEAVLYQRKSMPSHPGLGVTYLRKSTDPSTTASLLSGELPDNPGPRFMAWINSKTIGGLRVWDQLTFGELPDINHEMDNPNFLIEPRQLPDLKVECVVGGEKDSNKYIMHFNGKIAPPQVENEPLQADDGNTFITPPDSEKGTFKPEINTFQCNFGEIRYCRARYFAQGAGFQVVYASIDGNNIGLYSQDFRDLKKKDPVKLYNIDNAEILDFQLPGHQKDADAYVDILFRPFDEKHKHSLLYSRIFLDSEKKASEIYFDEPYKMVKDENDNENIILPSLWSIPLSICKLPVVLIKLESALYMIQLAGESAVQSIISEGDHINDLTLIKLISLHENDRYNKKLWFISYGPRFGIVTKRL